MYALPSVGNNGSFALEKRSPEANRNAVGKGKKTRAKVGKALGVAKGKRGKGKKRVAKRKGKKAKKAKKAKKGRKGKGKAKKGRKAKKAKKANKGAKKAKNLVGANPEIDALQAKQDALKVTFDTLTAQTTAAQAAAQNLSGQDATDAFDKAVALDRQKDLAEARFDAAKKATEAAKKAAGIV